jgi:ABC-type nitrate/sulfonate/bicarbonate transport system substrate-binding protein
VPVQRRAGEEDTAALDDQGLLQHYLQSNPALAVKFVKVMQDGVSYAQTNPAPALTFMESQAGISAATAEKERKAYQTYDLAQQPTAQVLGVGSGIPPAVR